MKEVRAAAGVLLWLMVCPSLVACATGPSGIPSDSAATTKPTSDINSPDQKNVTFYPLDRFKDSPEMVAEAMVKTGGKWDDAKCKLSFVMGKTTAEAWALSSLIGMYEVPFLKP